MDDGENTVQVLRPGGGSHGSGTGSGWGEENVSLEANPEGQLKYNKTSLTANAGKVSIDVHQHGPAGPQRDGRILLR